MSELIFIDSFDHYIHEQAQRKWNGFTGEIIAGGRTGRCISSFGHVQTKAFNQTHQSMTVGVAFQFRDYSGIPITFGYQNIPASLNSEFALLHNDDGRFYLHWENTGAANQDSGVTSFVAATGIWYYFEVQAKVTPGPPGHLEAILRVNGATVLTWSADVASTGLPFNQMGLNINGYIDDLYVTDDEFLGDVRIGVLYPNAAGDSAAWTPNAAGANYTKVLEHPTVDDDTTYVSAATVALKDLYHLDNIDPAFTGTIKGVQALWCVKKSDEGVGAVKGLWKSGSTEITQAAGHNYVAPDGFYPSASNYNYDIQTVRKSLFTAADWTKTEIDALQLGITRTA